MILSIPSNPSLEYFSGGATLRGALNSLHFLVCRPGAFGDDGRLWCRLSARGLNSTVLTLIMPVSAHFQPSRNPVILSKSLCFKALASKSVPENEPNSKSPFLLQGLSKIARFPLFSAFSSSLPAPIIVRICC